jgi:hypothetical protein
MVTVASLKIYGFQRHFQQYFSYIVAASLKIYGVQRHFQQYFSYTVGGIT